MVVLGGYISPLATSRSLLSPAYMIQAAAICFWLLMHCTFLAATFARASAGSSNAARMAMIAITTSSSMSVNPGRPFRMARMSLYWSGV